MISEEPTSLNTHSISFDLYKWPIFYLDIFIMITSLSQTERTKHLIQNTFQN